MTVENENEGKKDESGASNEETTDNNLWGSDMYPERRGAKLERSWFKTLIGAQGRESIDKNRCEDNVYRCIQNSKISYFFLFFYFLFLKRNRKGSDINLLLILHK